jgi:FAD synthase
VRWLREEVKFESLDALVEQMHRDAARSRELLGLAPASSPARG